MRTSNPEHILSVSLLYLVSSSLIWANNGSYTSVDFLRIE